MASAMIGRGISNATGDLGACRARTHATIDLAQDELHRLIDQFKQPSLIRLLGCDGLALFRTMEMKAMDLCIVKKPVRILLERC